MNTPHILLSTYGFTDDQIDQMYEDANYNNIPVKYRIKRIFSILRSKQD